MIEIHETAPRVGGQHPHRPAVFRAELYVEIVYQFVEIGNDANDPRAGVFASLLVCNAAHPLVMMWCRMMASARRYEMPSSCKHSSMSSVDMSVARIADAISCSRRARR